MDAGTEKSDAAVLIAGTYRIICRIGSGGMASVFEAEDVRLGQRVALKQLHPHIAERPGASERFVREGRAAARIRHPNVVQVFALGEDAGAAYLAMELLEGLDLGALLEAKGRLGVTESVDIFLPLLAGVAAAHDAGVVHRDLKPSNVFITIAPSGQRQPKVVDFGVSKFVTATEGRDLTATDAVVGTAAYMAPEQARASRNATFASDQYSLAVILYQCLAGDLPFKGADTYELLQAIMTAPYEAASTRSPEVPSALDAIVGRAMSRRADERFESVRELGALLLPFASEATRAAYGAELREPAHGRDWPQDAAAARQPSQDAPRTMLSGTVPVHVVPPRATKNRGAAAAAMTLLASVGLWGALRGAGVAGHRPNLPSDSAEPSRAAVVSVASAHPDTSTASPASEVAAAALSGDRPPSPASSASASASAKPGAARGLATTPRRERGTKAAARPEAASATGRRVTLGENDAPILP